MFIPYLEVLIHRDTSGPHTFVLFFFPARTGRRRRRTEQIGGLEKAKGEERIDRSTFDSKKKHEWIKALRAFGKCLCDVSRRKLEVFCLRRRDSRLKSGKVMTSSNRAGLERTNTRILLHILERIGIRSPIGVNVMLRSDERTFTIGLKTVLTGHVG